MVPSDRDIAHQLREEANILSFAFERDVKRVEDKSVVVSAAVDTIRCLQAFVLEHQDAEAVS